MRSTTTYDVATDFSTTVNPGPIWSYGELATESAPFAAYPAEGPIEIVAPVEGWHTAGSNGPPYVAINPTAAPVTVSTVVVPPGAIDMHPGASGEYSAARFTAPSAGAATIAVTFTGLDVGGTTTDVHVLHDGVPIADGAVNGYGDTFTQSLTVAAVAAGDTFDFIVGYGSNGTYVSDSTQLAAQVTFDAAAATPAKRIGGLDPTFGTNGLASHDVGFAATNGVAADGSQSVLVGPVGAAGAESFGVTRFNADGSLDTGFGTAGVATAPFAGADAVPAAVAVLADGDVLVAGTATTAAGSQFAVAEFTAGGVLDAGFGTAGQVLLGSGTTADVLRALAVGAGGVIYLGGRSDAAGKGNSDLAVAALTAAGATDAAFGGGRVLTDVAGGDDAVNGLAVQANGDVVAAGSATVGGTVEVALARYLATGTLDKRFGTKGVETDKVGGLYDAATSVAVEAKGQVVVGGLTATGSAAAPSSSFLVQRYTAAGKPDRSFDRTGTVVTSFAGPAAVTGVVVDADGSVVASGRTAATLGGTLDLAVARYTARGVLDTTFGTTGKVVVDPAAGTATPAVAASALGALFNAFTASEQGAVAVTPGGEILSAGQAGADTVEAELVAAGVDLVARVLSALPASVPAGGKVRATVTVTEAGSDVAAGSITIAMAYAPDAAGTGGTAAKAFAYRVNLKPAKGKSYKLSVAVPAGLSAGSYYVVATVADGTGLTADLDAANNTAVSTAAVAVR